MKSADFELMMLLLAMSLGLRLGTSRKGGTGGGGWVSAQGWNQMGQDASGLGCRKAMVGTGWAISLLVAWLGLGVLALCGLYFWQYTFFLDVHKQSLAERCDYWELINEWVCLESWICRGCKSSWVRFWASRELRIW